MRKMDSFGAVGEMAGPVKKTNPIKSLVCVALMAAVLGGCYLPVRFDAEIEISRGGHFKFEFDGYMASVPLYEGLRSGKIPPAKESSEVAKLERDLVRDSSVTEFTYLEKGFFKVNWKRSGDLFRARMVTFLRRNERIISIKYLKDQKRILIQGTIIARNKAQKLIDVGLNMEGRLRVRTDANVLEHNATKVQGGDVKTYSWVINSIFDKAPRMVIAVN